MKVPVQLQDQLVPEFPAAIDNTMRSLFALCPRKFFIEFVLNRALVGHRVDLDVGAAFAKALEATRRAYFSGAMDEQAAIALGARVLLAHYPDYDVGDSPKSLDRVFGAFGYYFDVFPLSREYFTPVALRNGQPAVEFSFAIPLPIAHPTTGDPILYCGRFDQLCEHRDGGVYVEDDKTTKQLGSNWAAKWRMRSQFTGYVWAAQQYGYRCRGAVVRGIAIRKTGFDHAEHITPRPANMVDAWYEQLLLDVHRMIDCWKSSQWSMNLADACDMYGGCGFQNICSSGSPWTWIADLVKREWSPIQALEDI